MKMDITRSEVIYHCPLDDCEWTHVEDKGGWSSEAQARKEALDQALMTHLRDEHTWIDALKTLRDKNGHICLLDHKIADLEAALTELKEKA